MKRIFWAILMILPLGAFGAEIYRSIDENGLVVYSDIPTESAELVAVETRNISTTAASASSSDDSDSEESDEDMPAGALIPREGTPEEIAADRARNCEYARQMQETYSVSHRLFREGADGEREYLSDAEIDEARSRAESNVASWCD